MAKDKNPHAQENQPTKRGRQSTEEPETRAPKSGAKPQRVAAPSPTRTAAPAAVREKQKPTKKAGPVVSALSAIFSALLHVVSIVVVVVGAICLLHAWQGGHFAKQPLKWKYSEHFSVPKQEITSKQLLNATTPNLLALFRNGVAPSLADLNGEMEVVLLSGSVFGYLPLNKALFHGFSGPGRWVSQEFGARGQGLNGFQKGVSTTYTRKFRYYLSRSNVDGKQSAVLDYSAFNRDALTHWRTDEVRIVNKKIMIGLAMFGRLGGPATAFPYLLKIRAKANQAKKARGESTVVADESANDEGWFVGQFRVSTLWDRILKMLP